MKINSPVVTIMLIIAVAVLFVLQFTSLGEKGEEKHRKEQSDHSRIPQLKSDLKIGYVNIDSLLSGYAMYLDKRDEFIDQQSSSQAKLQDRSQRLQEEFEDLQDKLNKGLITRAKARMMQEDLGMKEQELYQLRNQMTSELAEKEQVIYRQVLNSIMEYLDDYAGEHNYHLILSYSFGGPILYKEGTYNITHGVMDGLNKEYNEKQP